MKEETFQRNMILLILTVSWKGKHRFEGNEKILIRVTGSNYFKEIQILRGYTTRGNTPWAGVGGLPCRKMGCWVVLRGVWLTYISVGLALC